MTISQRAMDGLVAAVCDTQAGLEVANAINASSQLSSTEAGFLDGVTAGTAAASKALVLNSGGGIGTITSGTFTAANITTLTAETITFAAEAAEHGAGVIGTGVAPATYRHTEGGIIITDIKVDLEGLASKNTGDDVIGLAAGG